MEQGLSLTVGRLGMRNAAEQGVPSVVFGAGDVQRGHCEQTEDNKGEDPLEGNDLDGELA